jgi:hypothetical protein
MVEIYSYTKKKEKKGGLLKLFYEEGRGIKKNDKGVETNQDIL